MPGVARVKLLTGATLTKASIITNLRTRVKILHRKSTEKKAMLRAWGYNSSISSKFTNISGTSKVNNFKAIGRITF